MSEPDVRLHLISREERALSAEGRDQPILEVEDLTLDFAGVRALDGVSFSVEPGELFAVIGPNGAGKTSVFNCISGVYRPTRGRVRFDGRDVTGMRPYRIAALGVARTFQNVEVFPTMTVVENLLLGRYHHMRSGVLSGAAWWGRASAEEVRNRHRVEEIIDFLEIEHLRHHRVGALPIGLQKRVELGRALAMEPTLLLLDEPVAGMNQEETEDTVRFVIDVNEELGISIVLVEHDMGVVMEISNRVLVLDFGARIALGPPAEVARDPAVLAAYLGGALGHEPPVPGSVDAGARSVGS
ncbi:MAG: ABC transporter ATP-binding protein [Acidimicrobiia bacterium]|nr:ABC transporter ATP-binding protein [Acidimicrobiia bacterium]